MFDSKFEQNCFKEIVCIPVQVYCFSILVLIKTVPIANLHLCFLSEPQRKRRRDMVPIAHHACHCDGPTLRWLLPSASPDSCTERFPTPDGFTGTGGILMFSVQFCSEPVSVPSPQARKHFPSRTT